ncbi:MAG: response regulator [Planctomycetaceae bacterium]
MQDKPKILLLAPLSDAEGTLPASMREHYSVEHVQNPLRALTLLKREQFDGIYLSAQHFGSVMRMGRLLENDRILTGIPVGVALVDQATTILWGNDRLRGWTAQGNFVGETFFSMLGNPEIVGGEPSPFPTAARTHQAASSLLKTATHYFQLHVAPISDEGDSTQHFVATVRDVTSETQQRQKILAIQEAGRALADLKPEEIFHMSVDQRKDLLKDNILHFTKDLLQFDVIEIRTLDPKTGELLPLLEYGMDQVAANRKLFAKRSGNGVTGYVAAMGVTYVCEDTTNDPLYLTGLVDAKSSLTVPLKLHQQVIGTFNVESPKPHGFSSSDLQFLEIFCRDVAFALNTLDLLSAQRMNAAQESVEAIHKAVALPIDEILGDAVILAESHLHDNPETLKRLHNILRNARDIKQVIQRVGEKMAPTEAVPVDFPAARRPKLVGRRVLVVDGDNAIRSAAHNLLEPYGCVVETAQKGCEAELLYQLALSGTRYDVVVTGIDLPDMTGYDLMLRLKRMVDPVPLILTQAFGHDRAHTLCKARNAGLHQKAWIIKPFKPVQLLETVECIIDWSTREGAVA